MDSYVSTMFRYGKDRERDIKERLKDMGFHIRPSTPEQDYHEDIDFFMLDVNNTLISVSLKSPQKLSDDICLEFYHVSPAGLQFKSWFYNSKADVMMVAYPDGSIYLFWFDLLREYMRQHGKSYRLRPLSQATQEKLKASGYKFHNNLNKWVNRQDLLDAEVGYQLA